MSERCGRCGRVLPSGDRALTTLEVADKLGVRLTWLYRNRKKLRGFPAPLPGLNHRWSQRAVEAWMSPPEAPPSVSDALAANADALAEEMRRKA